MRGVITSRYVVPGVARSEVNSRRATTYKSHSCLHPCCRGELHARRRIVCRASPLCRLNWSAVVALPRFSTQDDARASNGRVIDRGDLVNVDLVGLTCNRYGLLFGWRRWRTVCTLRIATHIPLERGSQYGVKETSVENPFYFPPINRLTLLSIVFVNPLCLLTALLAGKLLMTKGKNKCEIQPLFRTSYFRLLRNALFTI